MKPSNEEKNFDKVLISRHILLYAFRYCLGRQTYAVSCFVSELKEHWHILNSHQQELIRKEIKEAIKEGDAGMSCDVREWEKVLEWQHKGETK